LGPNPEGQEAALLTTCGIVPQRDLEDGGLRTTLLSLSAVQEAVATPPLAGEFAPFGGAVVVTLDFQLRGA